jgi:hypothetical protein
MTGSMGINAELFLIKRLIFAYNSFLCDENDNCFDENIIYKNILFAKVSNILKCLLGLNLGNKFKKNTPTLQLRRYLAYFLNFTICGGETREIEIEMKKTFSFKNISILKEKKSKRWTSFIFVQSYIDKERLKLWVRNNIYDSSSVFLRASHWYCYIRFIIGNNLYGNKLCDM